jgi:hypothetical protein
MNGTYAMLRPTMTADHAADADELLLRRGRLSFL